MFLPFGNSEKEVMIRRARALFELLLPCLALAAVVFSFLPSRSRPVPTYGHEQVAPESMAVQETSSTSAGETARTKPARTFKKLTTYTILGTF